MTTIVYRDGVLAADSLGTANGLRVGYAKKIRKIGNVLAASCGSVALCEKFFDWVRSGLKGNDPFCGIDEGNGLVVTPEGHVICFGKNGPSRYAWPYFAMGSGEPVAVGALEMGASATEAVAAAIRVDVHSGGVIHSIRF